MNQHYLQLVRRCSSIPGGINGSRSRRSSVGSLQVACALILITLALAPHTSGGAEAAEKLKDAIATAVVTQDRLSTLSVEEVPEKWRTRVEDKSRDNLTIKVFWRGKDKVLQVLWRNDWTGTRSNMFSATVYDGQTKIGKIAGLPGEAAITQPKEARDDYSMITSIKDSGRVSVMFCGNRGQLQVIEVKGRETRLLDDIEFTKMAIGIDQILPPLWEAIDELRNQPKEKTEARDEH